MTRVVYKLAVRLERSSVSFQFSFGASQLQLQSCLYHQTTSNMYLSIMVCFLSCLFCKTFHFNIFYMQICLAAFGAIRPVSSSYGYLQPERTNYYTTPKPYYTTAAPYYTTPKTYYTTAAPYYTTSTPYYTTTKTYYQPTQAYTTSKPYVQPTYTTQPTYYQPQQASYTTPSYYPENYEGDDNVSCTLRL